MFTARLWDDKWSMSCVGALSSEVVYFAFGVVGIHFYWEGKCLFSLLGIVDIWIFCEMEEGVFVCDIDNGRFAELFEGKRILRCFL